MKPEIIIDKQEFDYDYIFGDNHTPILQQDQIQIAEDTAEKEYILATLSKKSSYQQFIKSNFTLKLTCQTFPIIQYKETYQNDFFKENQIKFNNSMTVLNNQVIIADCSPRVKVLNQQLKLVKQIQIDEQKFVVNNWMKNIILGQNNSNFMHVVKYNQSNSKSIILKYQEQEINKQLCIFPFGDKFISTCLRAKVSMWNEKSNQPIWKIQQKNKSSISDLCSINNNEIVYCQHSSFDSNSKIYILDVRSNLYNYIFELSEDRIQIMSLIYNIDLDEIAATQQNGFVSVLDTKSYVMQPFKCDDSELVGFNYSFKNYIFGGQSKLVHLLNKQVHNKFDFDFKAYISSIKIINEYVYISDNFKNIKGFEIHQQYES